MKVTIQPASLVIKTKKDYWKLDVPRANLQIEAKREFTRAGIESLSSVLTQLFCSALTI
jgi:hypothetical protein